MLDWSGQYGSMGKQSSTFIKLHLHNLPAVPTAHKTTPFRRGPYRRNLRKLVPDQVEQNVTLGENVRELQAFSVD